MFINFLSTFFNCFLHLFENFPILKIPYCTNAYTSKKGALWTSLCLASEVSAPLDLPAITRSKVWFPFLARTSDIFSTTLSLHFFRWHCSCPWKHPLFHPWSPMPCSWTQFASIPSQSLSSSLPLYIYLLLPHFFFLSCLFPPFFALCHSFLAPLSFLFNYQNSSSSSLLKSLKNPFFCSRRHYFVCRPCSPGPDSLRLPRHLDSQSEDSLLLLVQHWLETGGMSAHNHSTSAKNIVNGGGLKWVWELFPGSKGGVISFDPIFVPFSLLCIVTINIHLSFYNFSGHECKSLTFSDYLDIDFHHSFMR